MTIHRSLVLTAIPGGTGLAMRRALIAGAPDPQQLAHFRPPGGTPAAAAITQAVTGTWDVAHLCNLQQSVDLFDYYTAPIVACAAQLEQPYQAMEITLGAGCAIARPVARPGRIHIQERHDL